MDDPNHYKGREHSGVKHYLLKSYLERLFMIIGQSEPRICYVDCFAGPWQQANDELVGTSIALSLEVMSKCRDSLQKMGRSVSFRALFIEKDSAAFGKLESYLQRSQRDGIYAEAMNGDFHHLRDNILNWCGSRDFAFLFIDPKGWKNAIEIPTLTTLLQRPRSEFLINFMYDFLLRTHTQTPFQDDMRAIFGEVPDTTDMSPKEREKHLLQLYRNSLKAIPLRTNERLRSAYVTILDPFKERTKYHLIYLTRHPLGIIKFMEASEKMEIVQKRIRAQTKHQRRIELTGQEDLFHGQLESIDTGAVDALEIGVVKTYWLNQLSTTPRRYGNEDLAGMLEDTNWFETDLQQAFKELVDEGRAANLDALRKRNKKPIHFAKKERLQRMNDDKPIRY